MSAASLVSLLPFAYACQPVDTAPLVGSGHGLGAGGAGASSSSGTTVVTDGGTVVSSGNVTTLAAGVFSPQSIVLGPDNVYWTTAKAVSSAGSVGDASTAPGSVETVLRIGGGVEEIVTGLPGPGPLAIAGNTLFFGAATGGTVGSLLAFTLGTTTLDDLAAGLTWPFSMGSNTTTLYWANGNGTKLTVDSINTADLNTSAVGAVAVSMSAYQPVSVVVLESSAYVLATSAGSAYLLSASEALGTVSELWHEASVTPVALSGVGAELYWTLANTPANGGELLTVGISGGTAITLASGLERPSDLAVLDGTIYLTSNVASGSVLSVSAEGGTISTLASGLLYPYPIAVDDAVYVGTENSILSIPK